MHIISPNNSIVQCPKCNSTNIYKFGKDLNGLQKYQCQCCKRQFTLLSKHTSPKYHSCPICGRSTFLHHDYKFYSNFRCGDKKCNHSFNVIKYANVPCSSSDDIIGKASFKRMRHSPRIIISALRLYFLHHASTRQVASFLYQEFNISVSHVSIASWVTKFAPLFNDIFLRLSSSLNLNSDEWHADETVISIKGVKHYIWFIIDSETRFIIGYHLTPYRDHSQAYILFNNACRFGNASTIVTDRLASYNEAANRFFKNHIRVKSFTDDISNNLIESFNGSFKDFYRTKKGFKSFNSANNIIFMFVYFYNFVRKHSSLNGLTPAQVAGAKYTEFSRINWLLI